MLRAAILIAIALLYLPGQVGAQDKPGDGPVSEAKPLGRAAQPTQGKVAPGGYEAMVLAGTRKIVVRDFSGAIALLRDAAAREPNRPEAFCRIADAELAQGNLAEAHEGYASCERFASATQDAHQVTLALVGLARVLERQYKLREAREGWLRLAAVSREELALALAQARVDVLDALTSQGNAYKAVRERLASSGKPADNLP